MKQNFNFEQVGKRMPYSVPEGFFTDMEKDLWKEISRESSRRKDRVFYIRIALAATAIAATTLFFVFNADVHKQPAMSNELAKIDKAFNNLNTDDQAYLLDVYQNDVFFNDN